MASYHFAVQVLKRGSKVDARTGETRPGASAVAAAAYRARTVLKDERRGVVQDYRRKGGLQHAEIMLPEGAARWLGDREKLWNHVEALETRKDAQLAREINVALPHELTDAQRIALVRQFVGQEFVSRGMVADIAWHKPVAEHGDDPRNYHAHIMLTLRQATGSGLRRVKTREWNSRELLGEWREAWRDHQNSMLREAGHTARVDHRSLADQREEAVQRRDFRQAARLDRVPEIHVGPRARKIAQRQVVPESHAWLVGPRRPRRQDDPHRFGFVHPIVRETMRVEAYERRLLDYRRIDRGSRVDRLSQIHAGNDRRLEDWLVRKERQLARLNRKLDRWSREMAFKLEGAVQGKKFRWLRVQKAAAEKAERERQRQKLAARARRLQLIRELKAELELVFIAARGGREAVLARQRQITGWRKPPVRGWERDRGEGRRR
ncbi:MobQ family relaxase [Jiella pacifica]|uniref:MobA/MobL family protein n=1 Tax=Jiella pacifica TaxID=2696469 RepID=A0A6N9T927_9HYPH|nr:MobQ family relaxase [Jiella pacifica]NDW07790.1 MobA/MobL family protein [Jiella pacifica]